MAKLRNGLKRAVRSYFQMRCSLGGLGAGVFETHGMVRHHADLRRLRDCVVPMNDHVHKQFDERSIRVSAALLVLPTPFYLHDWIDLFLVDPFERVVALRDQVTDKDPPLLARDGRGNDAMWKEALGLAPEKKHACDARFFLVGRRNQ